jgi:DMSO reductase anchor subunit
VIRRGWLQEWPLAGFTLAIQIACGLALATTMAAWTQTYPQSAALRACGMAVFPMVLLGLLLSMMHLGRPWSAWRALTNVLHSRLSQEVLMTAAFAASSLLLSLAWSMEPNPLRLYAGAIASICGITAVIAGAVVYRIPTRPIWNLGWVMTSFIGTTILTTSVAQLLCGASSHWIKLTFILGSLVVVLSTAWMWRSSSLLTDNKVMLRAWLIAYLLLTTLSPLPLIVFDTNTFSRISMVVGIIPFVVGMLTGRMLMFTLVEFEPAVG